MLSLACRRDSNGGYRWMVCISGMLRRQLAWASPTARQAVDVEGGLLLITPTAADDLRGYAASENNGAWQMTAALPTPPSRPIGSTILRYEVQEDCALLIYLPIWAGGKEKIEPRGMRKARGRNGGTKLRVVPQPEPAKPLSSQMAQAEKEDLREAALMLRGGATTVAVMEHFGWARERVENLRRTLASVRRVA